MITTADPRPTRFELLGVRQDGDHVVLTCSDRSAPPETRGGRVQPVKSPELRLGPDKLTQEQWDVGIAWATIVENAYATEYDSWAEDPARNRAVINEAAQKKVELEATNKALAAARAELEQLQQQIATTT